MSLPPSFVAEFVREYTEVVDQVGRDLADLRESPTDANTLARMFRGVHSLKGAAGFLGFSNLVAVATAGEHLLDRLRKEQLAVTTEITSTLSDLVGTIVGALRTIDETGAEGGLDHTGLIQRLRT